MHWRKNSRLDFVRPVVCYAKLEQLARPPDEPPGQYGNLPLVKSRVIAAYLLGMLFFLYAFVQRVAPSVMTGELMRDLAVGATSLGVLSSAYFYTYALLQLPIGLLTDRFGPRRLMSVAALVCAAASLGFAYSDTLWSASFYRAWIGAGVAFAFVGTLAILVEWFPTRRFAFYAGFLQSMGMFGALAGQTPLRWFIENHGWRTVFVGLAILAAALAFALYRVVPRRPVSPESVKSPTGNVSFTHSLMEVIRNPQSWVCAFFGFGMAAPMLAFAGLWAIPWLINTRGWSDAQAAAMVAWLFIGWAITAPLAGWLSDKLARRKPVMIAGAVMALSGMVLLVYVGGWLTWQLATLFFITGCGGSTMIVLFGSVRELNRPSNNAAAMGFCNMFVVGSGGIMQFLLGWLLDSSSANPILPGSIAQIYDASDFRFAFNAILVTSVLALLAALLIRETHCRQQVN